MTFSSDHTVANIEEKTEVIYGEENIINATLQLFSIARCTLNCCIDSTGPSMLVIPKHPITKAHYVMKERGVIIRFVTEITKENITHCRELMNFGEVRHLDETKGNFGVLDGIYYRASAKARPSSPPPLLLSSTVRAFVEQQEYFFDMLWKKAIPAKQRIKEIEENLKREFIETIQDSEETTSLISKVLSSATEEIVTDRELSLVIEEKENKDDKVNLGLATYSNSDSTVLSYASLFENLWVQSKSKNQVSTE